jgi:hypothetical protein
VVNHPVAEPLVFNELTEAQFKRLVEVMVDPDAVAALLPEEEQRQYRESMESIVNARRAGERLAHQLWIAG